MQPAIEKALKLLTSSVNLSTGLGHVNDKDKAKEVFKILHENGEILLKEEIKSWAVFNGWKEDYAEELGSLAQQVGEGKKVRIIHGPWFVPDIYQRWSNGGK